MKRLNLESVSVDVIVTSPPYNLNKEYGSYKDNKERDEYLNWLYEIAQLSYLILKDNGSFFLNIGGTPSDPILPFEVVDRFRKTGYRAQNTIHWIKSISFEKEDVGKNNGIRNDYSIGHFKPIISERFLTDLHEYIFHLTKVGNVKLDKRAIGVPIRIRQILEDGDLQYMIKEIEVMYGSFHILQFKKVDLIQQYFLKNYRIFV